MLKFIQGMPISLGPWEWGCPKSGDAHITGTPRPFLSPVSSRFILMFALSQFPRTRLSRSLEQARQKGTRRLPDQPTYHPSTLDTSTFSPQIARLIIQDGGNLVTRVAASTGVYNLLSSSTITTASRFENLSSSYGGNENASCTWRYWGVVGNNYGRDVTSGSQTPEENGLI